MISIIISINSLESYVVFEWLNHCYIPLEVSISLRIKCPYVLFYISNIGFKPGQADSAMSRRNNFNDPWYRTHYLVYGLVSCNWTVHSSWEKKKRGGGDLKFEYFSEILCTRQMISPAWLVSKKSRNIHGFVLTVFLFTKQQISINITLPLTLVLSCILI